MAPHVHKGPQLDTPPMAPAGMPVSIDVRVRMPQDLADLKASIRDALTRFTSDPLFMRIVSDLMQWPHWVKCYSGLESRPLFEAAVVVAKMIVHYAYDMFTGAFLLQRVSDGLERAKALGYHDNEANIHCIDVLAAMLADREILDECDADLHAAAASHANDDGPDFWTSIAANADLLATCLRSAACLTGCIVRLNIDVVTRAVHKPSEFKGFVRHPDKANEKHTRERAWNNYFFDLSAMWLLVCRFREALRAADDNALHHALHRAHLWSLTAALASSAEGVARHERHLAEALGHIQTCARILHWLYLRARDFGRDALNLKKFRDIAGASAAKDLQKRWMARVSAATYASWGSDIGLSVPDVSGAVLVDNMFAYSNVSALQAGIQSPTGALLIGSIGHDLQYAGLVSELAGKVTSTDAHMWASVSNPKPWANHLERVLPPAEDIYERVLPFADSAPWIPSLAEMRADLEAYKKNYWNTKAKHDRDEIEQIMASMQI